MGATATVKGGLHETLGVMTLTQVQGRAPGLIRIARQALGKKSLRALRELATTLNGVAAGQAASAVNARIVASSELGGKRAVESEHLVNRNTAAGDVTELNDYLFTYSSKTYDPTPVANGDGNPLGTR
jgi:hypothetical protein